MTPFYLAALSLRTRGLAVACAASVLTTAPLIGAATLSDPAVDKYNVCVGTQTFAGLYQFTTNSLLVETAEAIRDLGSDIIKFYHGKSYPRQYRITLPANITNLVTLAHDEPSCRRVLDMPFRHFVMWVYPFSTTDSAWVYGYTPTMRANDYRELYDLTKYLLTNYNNSGKAFYFGHWEGDWYLLPNYNTATNPSPTAIQGMIDWLNNRQKAIDDAKRDTVHSNVDVFGYAEANRVLDAMSGNSNINQRVINKVVPCVTNLDFVSWSSYDGMNLGSTELTAALNFMQSQLPTNKAGSISGRRLFVGEYGWGALSSDEQEPLTRAYLQRLLPWSPRFVLFWEIYNNETNRNFWLVNSNNTKVASWHLHHRFINHARLFAARFKETNGRLPSDPEFALLMTPMLNAPLAPLVSLTLSNGIAAMQTATAAQLTGTLTQGVYGDDCATVWVFWGRQDGGTVRSAWEQSQNLGPNTNFNPVLFTAQVTNLVPQTNYYFRFYATNASGEAWAPTTSQFSTVRLNPTDYGSKMNIAFTGYHAGEALKDFPVLLRLGATLPGFSYRQFASATGGDLRFTDASGQWVLAHEVDEWSTNGVSSVWVRLPQLANAAQFIWAFWGNPLATNAPGTASSRSVWAGGFDLVWHLKESGFPYADSAGNYPSASGIAPGSTSGLIGRGAVFNGTSQYLIAEPVNLGNAFTLSAWVKLAPTATNIQTVWANKPGGWNSDGFALFVNSYNTADGRLLLETGNGSGGTTAAGAPNLVTAGVWHHVAAAVDRAAGDAHLYVDGIDCTQNSAVRSDFAVDTALNLGRFTDGSFYFKGSLDEARIEPGARSSNWLYASYATSTAKAALASCSTVEHVAPVLTVDYGNPLTLSWPANGVGFVLYTATNLLRPVVWSPAANVPSLLNREWQVELTSNTLPAKFFRLQF